MKIITDIYKSPNFNNRAASIIDIIVIHSTHMHFRGSMDRLCDASSEVSCHYIINLNGDIYRIVKDKHKAWHAGKSYWRGREKLNDFSIGIELVDTTNDNLRIKTFAKDQMRSILSLCKDLMSRYNIGSHNIVAHSDIAPSRKDDPGEGFDWKYLADNEVGVYPTSISEEKKVDILKMQQLLSEYGYETKVDGVFGNETRDVIIAFKRHFYPSQIDSTFDSKSLSILKSILRQVM